MKTYDPPAASVENVGETRGAAVGVEATGVVGAEVEAAGGVVEEDEGAAELTGAVLEEAGGAV